MTARAEFRPAREVPPRVGPLTGAAYDLAAMLEALDVLHTTGFVTGTLGGAYPEGACEVERRAINALGPMIQTAIKAAWGLAEEIDKAEWRR